MVEARQIELDDSKYTTTLYLGRYGIKLFFRLCKYAGKPMEVLFSSEKTKLDFGIILLALAKMADSMDEDHVVDTIAQILSTTSIKPKEGPQREVIIDNDFRGRTGHLFKLLPEVLRFQYNDFLEGLAVLRKKGQEAAKQLGIDLGAQTEATATVKTVVT